MLVTQAQDTNLSSFEDPFNLITGFRPSGYGIRTRFHLPFLLGPVLLTGPYRIVMPPCVLVITTSNRAYSTRERRYCFPLKMTLPRIHRFHGLPLCLSHVEQPVWGSKLSPACSTATLFCPYDRAMSVSGAGFPPPVSVDLLPHGP